MEIEHENATQELLSSNLVAETGMMELKESDTVTQEPVFLKIFVETTVQTETVETQEVAVHTKVETTKTQEVAVQTEDDEATDHILDVQTQESATQVEVAEIQEIEEVSLLKIEVSILKCHAIQFDEGMISITRNKNIIQ